MVHMFWFSMGLNNPSVWDPIYRFTPGHCLIWLVLLLFMYILLYNITLSMIYNGYEEFVAEETDQIQSHLVAKITGLCQLRSIDFGGQAALIHFVSFAKRPTLVCPREIWGLASRAVR